MTTFFDQTVLKLNGATTIAQNLPADDFTVTSTVLASGATVRLLDGSSVQNNKLDTFNGRVNWAIYSDAAGHPGTLIASGNGANVVETSDGISVGAQDICTVKFDFGKVVQLTPGTYWFSLDEGNQGEAYDFTDPYILDTAGNGTVVEVSFNGGTSWVPQPIFTGMAFSLQSTQAPSITTGTSHSVAENAAFSIDVQALDPDKDPVTFSITGGADKALFAITPGGTLSLLSPANFDAPSDAGANNVYEVEVTATDSFGATDVKSFSLTVTNVNEAPVFTSGVSVSVAEGLAGAYAATATDDENDTLSYAISGADAALFDIDSATGAVSFKVLPDFEAPADQNSDNTYDIIVTADDGNGHLVNQAVAITVTDQNDDPVFTSAAAASVVEGNTAVLTVKASDPDAGDTLQYLIVDKDDSRFFTIDPVTGVLSFIGPPDFEAPSDGNADNVYSLDVVAVDASQTGVVQTI